MNDLVWITGREPARAENGSYQAVRLIRFELEFWDRTPLEDQENDFGRHKASGAPMGKEHEHDDPDFKQDPHGDRSYLTLTCAALNRVPQSDTWPNCAAAATATRWG